MDILGVEYGTQVSGLYRAGREGVSGLIFRVVGLYEGVPNRLIILEFPSINSSTLHIVAISTHHNKTVGSDTIYQHFFSRTVFLDLFLFAI